MVHIDVEPNVRGNESHKEGSSDCHVFHVTVIVPSPAGPSRSIERSSDKNSLDDLPGFSVSMVKVLCMICRVSYSAERFIQRDGLASAQCSLVV